MSQHVSTAKLNELIEKAIRKVGGHKENDICRYVPSETGGYIHHFTMKKMKHENPNALYEKIEKYIVNPSNPHKVQPKQRAARGSRKRRDHFFFSKNDLERLLHMARISGDKDMVRKLTPRTDPRTIKRELLASIRQGRAEQDLWNSWLEAVNNLQPVEA
ncbi:MAG: hypothetical protein WC222_03945 [Parachlamydiales bacterium]|jgi:hypothetical protein